MMCHLENLESLFLGRLINTHRFLDQFPTDGGVDSNWDFGNAEFLDG
jgi:hypothetical protein